MFRISIIGGGGGGGGGINRKDPIYDMEVRQWF